MTIKIVIQNRETKRFFQSGTAWTMNGERAFDFQSIEAAQRFWRENQLVRVRIAFLTGRFSPSLTLGLLDLREVRITRTLNRAGETPARPAR
jgi:hypothetical protein